MVRTTALLLSVCLFTSSQLRAQGGISWNGEGNSYYSEEEAQIVRIQLPDMSRTVLVRTAELIPETQTTERMEYRKEQALSSIAQQ
jgi:hypothetical protein